MQETQDLLIYNKNSVQKTLIFEQLWHQEFIYMEIHAMKFNTS